MQKNPFLKLITDIKNSKGVTSVNTIAKKMSGIKNINDANCKLLQSALVVMFNSVKQNANSDNLHSIMLSIPSNPITEKTKIYNFFSGLGLRLKITEQKKVKSTLFQLSAA